jgi:8-amino-7-oxononanoate synthase
LTARPGGPRTLSSDERAALLAGTKRDAGDRGAVGAVLAAVASRSPSFDTVPAYESIRIQKDVARQIGLAVPFYRTHDAKAGVATEVDGARRINFTSYDYLGLNGHPDIVAAVAEASERWGTSVSASRLTSGERPFHRQFEGEIAHLYGAEDALLFVSGHATNLAVIGSVTGPGDLILHDALAHNSIVMGAEMSGAQRRNFPHNDLAALDRQLASVRGQYRNCLIVTEGLFSMDGDGPDLACLVEIKRRHNAWLMVDEAHSLGVLGQTGRGLFEHARVAPGAVDIWMGTLSKTLVSCGGYVAGPATLIEILKYRAPGMVYSVGISPPATFAAMTALDIMLREPQRVAALQANGERFRARAGTAGLDVGASWGMAVAPVLIGDSLQTVLLAERLLARGFAAVPVIPPGVPERFARLRFFLSSGHDPADIDAAVEALREEREALVQAGVSLSSYAASTIAERLGQDPGK